MSMSFGGLEFETYRTWFAPGVMQSACGLPRPLICRLEGAVVVEHLDALVAAVGGVDIALRIDRDAADVGELAGSSSLLAPGLHEHAVLVELGDARVAQAVGDEDVALRIPGDVGRTVEQVLWRPAPAARRPPPPSPPPPADARGDSTASALRPSSNATRPCGSNFMTMRRHLIDDPDVVLRIDADLRGEQEAVDVLADLADELAACDRIGTAASRHGRTARACRA